MNGMLNKVAAWFRAGYPTDSPQLGHAALLALCGSVTGVGVAGGAKQLAEAYK